MSRLPRRRARPGAAGTPPLRTKAHKQIGDGPVLQQGNRGAGAITTGARPCLIYFVMPYPFAVPYLCIDTCKFKEETPTRLLQ